ncbi:hypothetical protein TNCV_1060181 [Trichonephila clavipes]|nr:hypothetical protein TNCV_1060181 [Trichonephila clavipes]
MQIVAIQCGQHMGNQGWQLGEFSRPLAFLRSDIHFNYPNFRAANRGLSHLLTPTNAIAPIPTQPVLPAKILKMKGFEFTPSRSEVVFLKLSGIGNSAFLLVAAFAYLFARILAPDSV